MLQPRIYSKLIKTGNISKTKAETESEPLSGYVREIYALGGEIAGGCERDRY